MPELPAARRGRYESAFGLSAYDAAVLVADRDAADLFEATLAAAHDVRPKAVANWVTGEYLRVRNAASADAPAQVDARELAALVELVEEGAISRANAKEVLEAHVTGGDTVATIVEDRRFRQISDSGAIGAAVDDVLAANPGAVADYRAGKSQVIGFLVGLVMKATRGQANAAAVQAAIRERLEADAS